MSHLLELLAVMPAALAMTFVLAGVHGYLGLHVLRRKVIFVDLALAQIAALGGITAMALGFDPEHAEEGAHHTLRLFEALGWEVAAPADTTMVYAFSLVFALCGAAVFAVSRMRDERVPQEAFIGITFATAIAAALLLLVRVGGGAEQIRNMLARDALLFSSWTDVAKTAGLYGAIAVFHLVYWRRFFAISEDPEAARASGINIRLWDFLFYASFALVITESVQIAGVLLVFSYLVVPGAIGVLFATRLKSQVLLAWGTGFGLSIVGLLLCAIDNLEPPGSSPGPWIVTCLAGTLALVAVGRTFAASEHRRSFLVKTAAVVGGITVVVLLAPLLSKVEHEETEVPADPILASLAGAPAAQLRALEEIEKSEGVRYHPALAELLISDPSPEVTARAVEVAGEVRALPTREALAHTAGRPLDPGLKITVASALARLKDARAPGLLVQLLAGEELPPFDQMEAAELFETLTGVTVPLEDPEQLGALRLRWTQPTAPPHWDSKLERFVLHTEESP